MNVNELKAYFNCHAHKELGDVLGMSATTISRWHRTGIPYDKQLYLQEYTDGKLMADDPSIRADGLLNQLIKEMDKIPTSQYEFTVALIKMLGIELGLKFKTYPYAQLERILLANGISPINVKMAYKRLTSSGKKQQMGELDEALADDTPTEPPIEQKQAVIDAKAFLNEQKIATDDKSYKELLAMHKALQVCQYFNDYGVLPQAAYTNNTTHDAD